MSSPETHAQGLIAELQKKGVLQDSRVAEALLAVPRHLFAPQLSLDIAYRDSAMPIGEGQTISQPTVVVMMSQALELSGVERVLEIGTGSGYQAAILAHLSSAVYSIERIDILYQRFQPLRARLNLPYLNCRLGDGYQGWPEAAPFARIIVTAAPETMPPKLIEQLAEGGIIVVPVGPQHQIQKLMRGRKHKGQMSWENLGGVSFVPMVSD